MTADLLIVGSGLIGTSIGLALRGQAQVLLTDTDPQRLSTAVARGAGPAWDGVQPAAHALLAVPPRLVAGALRDLQQRQVAQTWSHVASVQAGLQREIETSVPAPHAVCGSHPMAGKEQSGPGAAAADLFVGRPWVLCPGAATSAEALDATRKIAQLCGAEPLELPAKEHDQAVALVSHLPQVAASAVAALLLDHAEGRADAVRLAGAGLQDTTRIAASDADLWLDVLSQNAAAVAPLVRALADELGDTAAGLERLAAGAAARSGPDEAYRTGAAAVRGLLERGNAGRRLVPRKRGEHDRDFTVVSVAVPDRPGQLAGVLVCAADAGVNVEDVRVEHLGGRPRGVIDLLVHASAQADARRVLVAGGWDVLG